MPGTMLSLIEYRAAGVPEPFGREDGIHAG